ncbi:hypothetical protein AX16_010958 [Volvariella volvacea WC 439]|nr:hypothetical protein AX16_010958 [Volvariella volvacea WC 439]
MFRAAKLIGGFKPPSGAWAISSEKLKVNVNPEWYKKDLTKRAQLLGKISEAQWEKRGLHNTKVTQLNITGAGLHRSDDPNDHFTGRGFDDDGHAVWFLDTQEGYYTNGIHFYPEELPGDLEPDRFVEVASDDPDLIAWCEANGRDIKTGKKISD